MRDLHRRWRARSRQLLSIWAWPTWFRRLFAWTLPLSVTLYLLAWIGASIITTALVAAMTVTRARATGAPPSPPQQM